jgi:predicted nucleic acid-binding protein
VEKRGQAMSKSFVLDCSLAMSWCFEEEHTGSTDSILETLSEGASALVPSLWLWEVNNVLLLAERFGRLNAAKRHQQIALLKKLPITIDQDSHMHAWSTTSALAATYHISVYDASYLELALRHGLPVGSLDQHLRNAAKKAGAKCLPTKL